MIIIYQYIFIINVLDITLKKGKTWELLKLRFHSKWNNFNKTYLFNIYIYYDDVEQKLYLNFLGEKNV